MLKETGKRHMKVKGEIRSMSRDDPNLFEKWRDLEVCRNVEIIRTLRKAKQPERYNPPTKQIVGKTMLVKFLTNKPSTSNSQLSGSIYICTGGHPIFLIIYGEAKALELLRPAAWPFC